MPRPSLRSLLAWGTAIYDVRRAAVAGAEKGDAETSAAVIARLSYSTYAVSLEVVCLEIHSWERQFPSEESNGSNGSRGVMSDITPLTSLATAISIPKLAICSLTSHGPMQITQTALS